MENIKDILKKYNITLSEFANELGVTRPTLYNYIKLFQNGNKLKNGKYQIIFDLLFGVEYRNKDEFMKNYMSFHSLLEREKTLGILELGITETDLIHSIIEAMREDTFSEDYNSDIYKFINLIINNYKADSGFVNFARYVLFLNGINDFDKINENEKSFISNCYRLMDKEKKGTLEFDGEYFSKFEKRINAEERKRKGQATKLETKIIEEEIRELIEKKIEGQIRLGVSVNKIDIKSILKDIDFSKK